MKYTKYILFVFFLFLFSANSYSQHLPLNIGNEWYYNYGFLGVNQHISTVVDTIRVKDKLYYKIENYDVNSHKITDTTYDRIDGDSTYYRIYGDTAKLIFNFAWQNNYIESSLSIQDSACTDLKLVKRDTINIWGTSTDKYEEYSGSYCPPGNDTLWTLSGLLFLKYFGCWNAIDGLLTGAKIDGITYGELLTTPVELLSFSKQIIGTNSVLLKWSTATETNNSGFEIVRSPFSDKENQSQIGFVKGSGTTTEKKDYEFMDKNLTTGEYEYQLVQIDFNGTRKKIAEVKVLISNPNVYTLYQNYPNPFNPSTTISYSIPKKSFVTLKVYDVLGRKLQTLVAGEKLPDKYKIIFDATKYSSGIYFYIMQSGDFIETKKLIIVK